jgi:two-component system LytT family response regulator
MKALIIEDELPASERLKKILAAVDKNLQVVNVCDSVHSSVSWLKTNTAPDIIFMDIELSDGRSFEIFKQVQVSSRVVFITAYDDFAIKAIKLNALDYLLKPVDREELAEALKKMKNTATEYSELPNAYEKIATGEGPKKLVVYDVTGARFVNIEKIVRLKADSNYTNICLSGGESIVASRTLKSYEEMLEGLGFFRVSNTYLINLQYVEKYIKGIGGAVVMTDGTTVEVSRHKKKELLNALSLNY